MDLLSQPTALRLEPGQFFGGARLACAVRGVEVTHRIAQGAADEVLTHTHADAHFILVTGGDYVSAAGPSPGPGTPLLVYNPPGTTHRDHFAYGRGSFLAISIAPLQAARLLADISAPDGPVYLRSPAQHALALRIARACSGAGAGLSLESLCTELLGSLDRRPLPPPRSPPAWLHAALELLRDRYREDLAIADIAAGVGVHPIHLARTFRRYLKCTPGEFARARRLERAADLLVRSCTALSEIALASGFADQSHFSRVFARCFGVAPGEYRALVGKASAARAGFKSTRLLRRTGAK